METKLKDESSDDQALVLIPQTSENFPELVAVGEIEQAIVEHPHSKNEPPMKYSGFYILVFVLISLNDGMFLGYSNALMAIFTENNVSSQKRALLYLGSLTYMVRLFFAPVTDKYFMPWLGKRKTYLLPCKLIATVGYLLVSFWIDGWVQDGSIVPIAIFFFFLNFFIAIENNTMGGFRIDFFGPSNSTAAGAASSISIIFGLCLGYQGFIVLNSNFVCTKYFKLDGPLINHADYFRIVASINMAGFFIITQLKEKSLQANGKVQALKNPIKVIKALFSTYETRVNMIFNLIADPDKPEEWSTVPFSSRRTSLWASGP